MEKNHKQTIIDKIRYLFICKISGHKRHNIFLPNKINPKYCYNCGKHISNWV